MKHLILTLALLTCSLLALAQKGISYQAVILDPKPIEIPGQDVTGQPFVNGDVSLKFKIFSSTFVQEFEEVHATQTDAYGMVNVLIGSVSQSSFSSLVWDSNPKNMQVWVSFDNGGTYTKVSEQVLTYNPYAIYAETAGKLGGTLGIAAGGTGATTAAGARTNLGLGNVDNTSDANKPVSIATQNALDAKASELTTYVNNQVAAATIPDADAANKGKIQLAGDLAGTAAAPTVPGLALKADALAVNAALNLKANAVDVANELALKANAAETRALLREKEIVDNKSINVVADADSDSKYPTVKSIKNYVDTQVAGATIADADASTKGKIQLAGDLAGTAAAPTVPGLALKANAADVTTALNTKASTSDLTSGLALKANTADVTTALNTKASTSDLTSGLALKANAADVTTALNTKASTSDLTSGLALKANTADMTAALALKAPLASPTFTGTVTTAAITTGALSSTAVTAPTYASAPRTLTYSGSTINWNPALGLNAAITLTQNSTLTFTAAPPVGSYGTVVLTQDGTGGRTITLPTLAGATNQVLGSTSTSTVALSTAASSKDILNFYYDGTIVYWNIGQGYGAASTTNSGPTNLASSVTGTLAVGNGGTGATTLSGLVKGNGTGAMTAAVAGTDYQAPLTLTTTGSGAASLSGTTLNIPATTNYALPTASASTLGGVKVGSNLSIDGSGVLSANVSAGTISGTVPVANGGTGQTTLAGVKNILGLTDSKIAIGSDAGLTNQGNNAIALGYNAGKTNQGASSIAIGYLAGGTATQGISSIAIGPISGGGGNESVAIGLSAWTGANNATAVGTLAAAGHVNSSAIGYQAVTTAPNTIQLGADGVTVSGSTAITNVRTSGSLTAGAVTYPNTNGTAGQVLTANNNGNASWTTIASVADASTMTGTVAITKGGTGATTATAALTNLGAAPLASPTFTGAVTAPIYASAPQALTFGSPISWNPANGLNASVTLTGNGTLSFSSPPTAGAYGTLVVTQDGTGSRTLTLPSVTNKVLGSATTTAIALSTAANAIDIVNFYYDGSNYFWNVGQGYGAAAIAATTNLASSVTGTLPVANGGTGATTLTVNNVLLGNGTSALQAIAPGASGNVLTSNGTTWTSSAPSGNSGSGGHYVGEVYGGGIVFYVTAGGYHGLIASSTDIVANPMVIFDRATSPSYKSATNSENLYMDWVTPTFSQLNLLYSARATAGLNLGSYFYISTTFTDNDSFGFKGLNFSNNGVGYANGNWTSGSSGGEIRGRAIRIF